ncbi:hypothetical protein [Chryseobacterium potabilaquae]|uniref:Uncharacterized protein n=1 Tax=Chryseobacterium potabilaquae TaxID=2675057 RepID=A0A6N4X8E3_9FLAO|nr:hypothetical protein [Chryseobacterium potabilaquae]CAA7195562.1 hypothetical protein CHRY9293_01749 [Chryseobacterium potabilaquae]
MKRKLYFLFLMFLVTLAYSQNKESKYFVGKSYDARMFLTNTQKVTFNKIFSDFATTAVNKNNKWNDVDPIKIFTVAENRLNRRNLFLYEYNPEEIGNSKPTEQQIVFKSILEKNIKNSVVLLDSNDIKISFPYTESYEKINMQKILLEKLSYLGLQWSQLEGDNLYIYNGNILIGKYKSGYVSLTNLIIDKP